MTLRIYGRGEWGARYSDGEPDVTLPPVWRENWLHHTGDPGRLPVDATFEAECSEMRRLEQVGEDRFGQGMSYTALIFPSGRVFEGHSLNRRGAHTYGHNDAGRAICYPGDYSTVGPTVAQLRSTAALLRHWMTVGGPGVLSGGHRDVYPTSCPGDAAYSRISHINTLATSGGVLEDDVSADDVLYNKPIFGPTNDQNIKNLNDAVFYTVKYANIIPRLEVQLTGLIAAFNAVVGGTRDAELVKAAVREAIEEGIVRVEIAVKSGPGVQDVPNGG